MDKRATYVAIIFVAMALVGTAYMFAQYTPVVETESYYDVEVGEEFTIEIPNHETSTEDHLYDASYDYNYSYQWNISGASDQNMIQHTNTIRVQSETRFYFEAQEEGNMTITFQYRVQNEIKYQHTAYINVTEG